MRAAVEQMAVNLQRLSEAFSLSAFTVNEAGEAIVKMGHALGTIPVLVLDDVPVPSRIDHVRRRRIIIE